MQSLKCPTCGWNRQGDGHFCPVCGRDLRKEVHNDPLVGEVINQRYRISRIIGRGGMGVVYQVEHIVMGKIMAMKLLHSNVTNRPHAVKRFRQEINVVSRLSHVHTISVFDCGVTKDNSLFIVMEYLRGLDLEQVLEQEKILSCLRAARIARQICSSLAEAHEEGIIHRDIKPANIVLLREQGELDFVKVLDFGIAKLMESGGEQVTKIGLIIGTPYYMAPEQARGMGIFDATIDIYSLGVVLYEMITGRLPFLGKTTADFIQAHLHNDPPPPSEVTTAQVIDSDIESIILCAMNKDPRQRFSSIDEMGLALEDYINRYSRFFSHTMDAISPSGSPVPLSVAVGQSSDENSTNAVTGSISKSHFDSFDPIAFYENADKAPVSRKTAPFDRDKTPFQAQQRQEKEHFSNGTMEHIKKPLFSRTPKGELFERQRKDDFSFSRERSEWELSAVEDDEFEPSKAELATKADWDAVEKKWRRKSYFRLLVPLFFFFALLGWGGYEFWYHVQSKIQKEHRKKQFFITEKEPNNTIIKATPIKIEHWISGVLGQRMAQSSSDKDWFVFELPKNEEHFVSISLEPPKFLDVELGLYKLGEYKKGSKVRRTPKEVISINNMLRGGEEKIPIYLLSGGRYYILVRELVVLGESPQENKGGYRLQIKRLHVAKNQEIEPNEQLSLAVPIQRGVVYKGFHDRKGDVDFYRFDLPHSKRRSKRRYRIRFYVVKNIKPIFLVLNAQGRPIAIRQYSKKISRWLKKRRRRKRYKRIRIRVIDLLFSGQGRFYLKISSPQQFNYKIPYKIILKRR